MKREALVKQIETDGQSLNQARERKAHESLTRGVRHLQQAHSENVSHLDLLGRHQVRLHPAVLAGVEP
ncbi:MAG: hypothetical protein AB7I41_09965 [Candidatus Sericytochromatia bacterium]